MKKNTNQIIRNYIIIILFILTVPVFSFICGDVNSDNQVNIIDALLIAQDYVGESKLPLSLADVSGDKVVTIIDALIIAQYYVGIRTDLPGCVSVKKDLPPESKKIPFKVKSGLFKHSDGQALGLTKNNEVETVTIFAPEIGDNAYNHGVVLIPFKGWLYAQWQTSKKDEDASDTHVVYSRSTDGKNWEKPRVLVPEWNNGYRSSGGWWTDGETLVAYINVWPAGQKPRGGYVESTTSRDGQTWSELKPLLNNHGKPVKGIFEQDPHALPDGRIISAVHEQPGIKVAPYYTDDPKGLTGWTKGKMNNLKKGGDVSREIEPSWFYRADGSLVMIFRDQNSTYYKLASISTDRGESWTTPVKTDMPDARTKQSAGNLPDGTAFMAGNPVKNKNRYPLVVTISQDGYSFDKAFLLRAGGSDMQPLRFGGKYKRASYSYPKSVVWEGYLYVSYATNKEDVELTRIPLTILK